MSLAEELIQPINNILSSLYGIESNSNMIQLQKTRKDFEGDITLVTFPFLKQSKKGPEQTGVQIGERLKSELDIVVDFNTVKGFLNLVIADSYWLDCLSNLSQAPQNTTWNKGRMMVEFSSPNTNKPLHLGHLRNIFLGDSVSHILEANGHPVVRTQIINDRGIHICKSMQAWKKWGNGETPQSAGLKGDKLVGKYYVQFDKGLKQETATLLESWGTNDFGEVAESVQAEYNKLSAAMKAKEDEKSKNAIRGKIKELANGQTPSMIEAKEMLRKWEAQDPEIRALWEKMNGWVYEGFEQTYTTMGVSFDQLYYESNTYISGKEMVDLGLEKGVFYEREDGSVWIDLSDEGLDEKLVLRSDGTAVYMTQDIGTAKNRMEDYSDLDGIVYTVGNEQDHHFKVLFLILKKLGFKWAENCYHLSYGMVDLPSGKMKSREGTVVDADDLMEDVITTAKEMTQERGHIEGMSEEEKERLYRMIGLGGLKYYLLKVDPKRRMLFNPEESVDLNGNTGPFIQYAHARICSLLRKAEQEGSNTGKEELHESERTLIKHLTDYDEVLMEAAKDFSPAVLANYTYQLAKDFNSFFQSVPILKTDDENLRCLRLQLSEAVGRTIKSAMGLLGIEVPERM